MLSVATLNIGHLQTQATNVENLFNNDQTQQHQQLQQQIDQQTYNSLYLNETNNCNELTNIPNNLLNININTQQLTNSNNKLEKLHYFNGQLADENYCDNYDDNDDNKNILVPFEWKREVIEGKVVYISPSNCFLWSFQEIVNYLQSEGTCKCGLECPLIISNIFNFDPKLISKAYTIENSSNSGTKLCNHRRKNIALSTYQKSTAALIAAGVQVSSKLIPSSTIASSTNEVLPTTVEISPHQLVTNETTDCITTYQQQTPLLELINPIHFAPLTTNTVTVLQSASTGDGTTIIFPQLVSTTPEQTMIINTGATQNGATLLPNINASGFTSIPLQVHNPLSFTTAQVISNGLNNRLTPIRNIPLTNRTRKKKDSRSNRHPPTVAEILREAEENERRQRERKRLEEELMLTENVQINNEQLNVDEIQSYTHTTCVNKETQSCDLVDYN